MHTLYDYWRSSASYRVRIALNLANEEWQSVSVDLLAGSQTSAEHLRRNPQGLVPVLDIDGRLMTQSLSIIEYLDETRKLGLLPSDPEGRAKVRALAYAVAMEIHPICNPRVVKIAARMSGDTITMPEWMPEIIGPGLAALEQMLEGGDFCYGDSVSLADLCIMPQLYNADRWKVDLSDMPKINRIRKHLETIEAFQKAHPDAFAPEG